MNKFTRNSSFRDKGRGDDRQMHHATCTNCGKDCKVPFKPTGSKPIYCSNCFERDDRTRGGERSRGTRSKGDGRGKPQMHSATCDDCRKRCEVPFKPSLDKPIYCSDCFNKGGDSSSNSGSDSGSNKKSNKRNEELNAKLDRILSLLEGMAGKKEVAVKKAPAKKKAVAKKEVAEKKAPAKKAPAKKKAVKKKAVTKKK